MPNVEGQTYLKNAVKDLLDRFALEYVLAELRDQVRYASVNPKCSWEKTPTIDIARSETAKRLDDVLRAYCFYLPGYRSELIKPFNPRW